MAMPRKSGLHFALSDPKRREICTAVHEAGRSSPRELSDELDIETTNLAYHVRVLAREGVLKLVREEPRRGFIKHVYELDLTEPWALGVLGLTSDGGIC